MSAIVPDGTTIRLRVWPPHDGDFQRHSDSRRVSLAV